MRHRYILTVLLLYCFAPALPAQTKVKLHVGAEIGGIRQLIHAEGNDDRQPLLLFLHGGPGFSSRAYSKAFRKRLKDDFIVAEWDQRETGTTLAWNASSDSLTLGLFDSDTEEVVDYLLDHFGRDKLYLVGFSWGGFLGFRYAARHPEKLHAYVAVSPLIDGYASDELVVQEMREQATTAEASSAINNLTLPLANWRDLYAVRRYGAAAADPNFRDKQLPPDPVRSWADRWLPLYRSAGTTDLRRDILKIDCPVYFFLSAKDRTAHPAIAEDYFARLIAPYKAVVRFPGVGHEIPSSDPAEFAAAMVRVKE